MHPAKTSVVLAIVAICLVGCGAKQPASGVDAQILQPRDVVQRMYEAALAGDDEKVLACFDMTTAAAVKELRVLAQAHGLRAPEPAMMFSIPKLTVGKEQIKDGTAEVLLVGNGGQSFPVALLLEGGEWRVTMSSFVEELDRFRAGQTK